MIAAVSGLLEALESGGVRVIDLTQPLSEDSPVLRLPPPFTNAPGLRRETLSSFDERGPQWAWSSLHLGEHVGTHFDAPIHWITGRDGDDLASIPVGRLAGPACVLDATVESAANPDHLVEVGDVLAFEGRHGRLPSGAWLLLRTGWEDRAADAAAFINRIDGRAHSPGLSAECARWLAQERPITGLGVDTVSTDAGLASGFEPPFPAHHYLLGAGKYGVTQLANLALLPPTGALVVVAPLKLVAGTGSPCRVLAFAPA